MTRQYNVPTETLTHNAVITPRSVFQADLAAKLGIAAGFFAMAETPVFPFATLVVTFVPGAKEEKDILAVAGGALAGVSVLDVKAHP